MACIPRNIRVAIAPGVEFVFIVVPSQEQSQFTGWWGLKAREQHSRLSAPQLRLFKATMNVTGGTDRRDRATGARAGQHGVEGDYRKGRQHPGFTAHQRPLDVGVPSAIQAVKQWHYRPYLLNGQPVEVETTITVIFTLT
jgi:hypothetical protein